MTKISPITKTDSKNNLLQRKYILPAASISAASIGSYYLGKHIDKKNLKAEETRFKEFCDNRSKRLDEAFNKHNVAANEYLKADKETGDLCDRLFELRKETFSEATKEKYNLLMCRYPDLVYAWEEGQSREFPNCIMFYGKDKAFADFLIDWYGEETTLAKGIFKKIEVNNDILEAMEAHSPQKPTNNYMKVLPSEKRQLLYVKDFDHLINPKIAEFRTVEAVKALMSAASSSFLTTILFYAENPNDLDDIAIESHRVGRRFDVDDPTWDKKEFKKFINNKREKARLSNEIVSYSEKVKEKKKIAEQLEQEYQNILKEPIGERNPVKSQKWKIAAIGSAILPVILIAKTLIKKQHKKGKKND